MDEREERIRERAHRLWEEEGRPDGRAEAHWVQATEILALEDGLSQTLKPIGEAGEPAEPIEALVNAGEFPTLTDQGEMQIPQHPETQTEAVAPANPPAKPRARRKSTGATT